MIDTSKIEKIVDAKLSGTELFFIGVNLNPGNEIEVLIDSDSSVTIESCIELSLAIEQEFDREVEDFELTVGSAGIGQPLKVYRQYKKLIGGSVEVVLRNGTKIIGTLSGATESSITLVFTEKVAVEGKKRGEIVEVEREYPLSEVKSTKEHLDFK